MQMDNRTPVMKMLSPDERDWYMTPKASKFPSFKLDHAVFIVEDSFSTQIKLV